MRSVARASASRRFNSTTAAPTQSRARRAFVASSSAARMSASLPINRNGWVQPTGYDWDSFLGRTVREISPSHQSRECRGPGRASEAPAERKMGDMMLWITLGAVYLAIGAVIGLVLEDRYSRRSSAGPRSLKDYVRSACTYAFIWPILFFYGKRR